MKLHNFFYFFILIKNKKTSCGKYLRKGDVKGGESKMILLHSSDFYGKIFAIVFHFFFPLLSQLFINIFVWIWFFCLYFFGYFTDSILFHKTYIICIQFGKIKDFKGKSQAIKKKNNRKSHKVMVQKKINSIWWELNLRMTFHVTLSRS